MDATERDDAEDKPLDPAVERVRGKLVRFMVINLGILLIALMAVVAAIVYRVNSRPAPPVVAVPELPVPAPDAVVRGEVQLPPGARVIGHALSGNRLSIDLALADGGRAVLIYDVAEGQLVGRLDIKSAP